MEWYQIMSLIVGPIVSILTLLGLGTVTKLYWEDKHKKKQNETEEAKKRQKAERRKEIIDAVSETMGPCSKEIRDSIQNIEKRLDRTEKCDQASLRNSLMSVYYACKEKGYRTEDDSKNYREMHEAYNEIGGNSFIDSDVSVWFDKIPLKPNDYELISAKKTRSKRKVRKEEQ